MWRPMEIFLYDWWAIRGQRLVYDRLSRMVVQVVYTGTRTRPDARLARSGIEARRSQDGLASQRGAERPEGDPEE